MYNSRKAFIAAELGIGSIEDFVIPKLRASQRALIPGAPRSRADDVPDGYWRRYFDDEKGTGRTSLT